MAVVIQRGRGRVIAGIPKEHKEIRWDESIARDGTRWQVRLRFRNGHAARIYLRTMEQMRCFVIEDRGDHWFVNPALEQGRNYRPWNLRFTNDDLRVKGQSARQS